MYAEILQRECTNPPEAGFLAGNVVCAQKTDINILSSKSRNHTPKKKQMDFIHKKNLSNQTVSPEDHSNV